MAPAAWNLRKIAERFSFLIGSRPYALTVPRSTLRILLVLALVTALGVSLSYVNRSPWLPDQDEKRASRLMHECLEELGRMRLETGEPVDLALDPSGSGLIGVDYSDITSSLGDLRAKQTSLNPSFAGLMVKWLKEAGVKPQDRIAVTFSGSFPALNLAVLSASEIMDLRPLIISSVGASMYGANIFGYTWLDMEKRLNNVGLLHNRSRYASLGGVMDTNGGVFETGIDEGEAAIARTEVEYLREGTPKTVERDALRRMELYFSEGRPTAFINVGGNVTAIGWVNETHLLGNGLLQHFPSCDSPQRGLLFRMHEKGVPVIHLLNIERLAAANHLPVAPHVLNPETDFSSARLYHLKWLAALLVSWFVLAVFCVRGGDVRA